MITHIVLYRLKDGSEQSRKALVERFLSMRGKIPQLRSLDAGSDLVNSARSYDVALVCTYDSLEDLEAYRVHPVHLPVMEYVKQVVAESHSVDYQSAQA